MVWAETFIEYKPHIDLDVDKQDTRRRKILLIPLHASFQSSRAIFSDFKTVDHTGLTCTNLWRVW